MDNAEKTKERLTFGDIEERVELQERAFQEHIEALAAKYPILTEEPKIFEELKKTSRTIRELMDRAGRASAVIRKGTVAVDEPRRARIDDRDRRARAEQSDEQHAVNPSGS